MADKYDCDCTKSIEMAALTHRSTMGKHVSWALFLWFALAGAELYWMRTVVLATALLPVIASLVHGYAERKRANGGNK